MARVAAPGPKRSNAQSNNENTSILQTILDTVSVPFWLVDVFFIIVLALLGWLCIDTRRLASYSAQDLHGIADHLQRERDASLRQMARFEHELRQLSNRIGNFEKRHDLGWQSYDRRSAQQSGQSEPAERILRDRGSAFPAPNKDFHASSLAGPGDVEAEIADLLTWYRRLIADRGSNLQQFLDSFDVEFVEPIREAGKFRQAQMEQPSYVWAVKICGQKDVIVLLPGKELIRRWPLFSKMKGSGAAEHLNGAYALQPDELGELRIIEPAIATLDEGTDILTVKKNGVISGVSS